MIVTLWHITDPRIAAEAAKTCIGERWGSAAHTDAVNYLEGIIRRGHLSVLEHITMTFRIEGISRAVLQQLARHRHVSLSVESTRWALHKGEPEFAFPDLTPEDLKEKVLALVAEIRGRHDIPNDVAKYLYPEALQTSLVLTTNLREFRHILELRSEPPAMQEFARLCKAMREAIPEHLLPLVETPEGR